MSKAILLYKKVSIITQIFCCLIILNTKELYSKSFLRGEINYQRRVDRALELYIRNFEKTKLGMSEAFFRYMSAYYAVVNSKRAKHISKSEILKKIAESRLLLVGDRHVAPHDQKTLLDILKALNKEAAPITLAIEFIDIKYQREIDMYLDGEIDLKTLKKRIEYDKYWGFNWSSFKRILKLGRKLRKKGFRIIATESCDHENKEAKSITDRDRIITSRIIEDFRAHPDHRYVVFFGSYHLLGKGHMKEIFERERGVDVKAVLSDFPEGFWRALASSQDNTAPRELQLDENTFYLSSIDPISYKLLYLDYLGVSLDDVREILAEEDLKLKPAWFGLGSLCRNIFKRYSRKVLQLRTGFKI